MSDPDVRIVVESRDDAFALIDALKANDIHYGERIIVRKHIEEIGSFIAELIFKPEVTTAALGALGGWLAARQGRKVRVKIGDIEAEATSVQELKSILQLAGWENPPDDA